MTALPNHVGETAVLDARGLRIRARRDVSTALSGAFRSAFRGNVFDHFQSLTG